MKKYLAIGASFALIASSLASCSQGDQKSQELSEKQEADKEEIILRIKDYVQAVNDRNVDKSADFWAEEAIYRNALTGELVEGREGIKKEYSKMFDLIKDAKVDLQIDTVRFPMDDKFVGEGVAWLSIPGRDKVESEYKMIMVKKDGQWYLLNVSELDFGISKSTK